MALIVHARRKFAGAKGSAGAWREPAAPHDDLAGVESWRTRVWGSPAMQRLGLRLLPSLAKEDLYASGPKLEELDGEVHKLQAALRSVVDELLAEGVLLDAGDDPYGLVAARLENIAEAIRLARGIPDDAGEVVIW